MKPYEYLSPLPRFEYHRPSTVGQALEILNGEGNNSRLLAGGTDLLINLKKWNLQPRSIIDISGLNEMKYIKFDGNSIEIGPLTTFSELENSEMIKRNAGCLYDASRCIATPQTRNLATIGGNLGTASPAADSAPPLLVLDSLVEISSVNDGRRLKVSELFTGVKKTVLKPNELIVKIIIPCKSGFVSSWTRVASRDLNVLSTVSVASGARLEGDVFADVRIALGAVAPTPMLAIQASRFLEGKRVNRENIERAAEIASTEAKPITDVRATAEYRSEMVRYAVDMTLSECVVSETTSLSNAKRIRS